MKSQNANQRNSGAGRTNAPLRVPRIPMEWMDPVSWRLPSGQALAEFALQAGFLAPLMLGTPNFKRRKKMEPPLAGAGGPLAGAGLKSGLGVEPARLDPAGFDPGRNKQAGEAPEKPGGFRDK
jgi:hypothetical protein